MSSISIPCPKPSACPNSCIIAQYILKSLVFLPDNSFGNPISMDIFFSSSLITITYLHIPSKTLPTFVQRITISACWGWFINWNWICIWFVLKYSFQLYIAFSIKEYISSLLLILATMGVICTVIVGFFQRQSLPLIFEFSMYLFIFVDIIFKIIIIKVKLPSCCWLKHVNLL